MSDEKNNKKEIEIVEGNGNLDISPVYEHLKGAKPKMQDEKPKNIVIPQPLKKAEKKEQEIENSEEDIEEDVILEGVEPETDKKNEDDKNSEVEDIVDIEDVEIEFEDLLNGLIDENKSNDEENN